MAFTINTPLVTIGVLTYNSAATVVETLESIKAQTYENIELLISDDASKDDTLSVCQNWLAENCDRFVRTELISTTVNTGTCGNCDRILKNALGNWLRLIAGDDILMPDAVSKFMTFATENPQAAWIFSKSKYYINSFEESNYDKSRESYYISESFVDFFSSSTREQYLKSMRSNILTPPADIVKTSVLRKVGGFEAKYGLNEDIVKDLKLSKSGVLCYYIDEFTMCYRVGASNVYSNTERLFNIKGIESSLAIRKGLCWKDMPWNLKAFFRVYLFTSRVTEALGMNKSNNQLCNFIYRLKIKFYKTVLLLK